MANRVYLHVGLPKTATSYLQTVLWASREQLRRDGVLLPGDERRDHLWASRVVREDPHVGRRLPREATAWDRLREELGSWDGRGLVSHEFFAAASADQSQRMVADLAPAEVHVLVTAREPLGLFTASWQESLKNRSVTSMERYSRRESADPTSIWNWRTLDLRLVLQRWAEAVPVERIHVLPLDPSAPREEIWQRFAGVVGLTADAYDLAESFPNSSMGVVEAELLRRTNEHLDSFKSALDRGVYIRSFLADERLVPRGGEKFWPAPDRIEECRQRGRDAVAYLRSESFDVRGDADHLLVPDQLPERRTPASVSDAEVAQAAVELVAVLMDDVRELRSTEPTSAPEPPRSPVSRLRRWWRSRRP